MYWCWDKLERVCILYSLYWRVCVCVSQSSWERPIISLLSSLLFSLYHSTKAIAGAYIKHSKLYVQFAHLAFVQKLLTSQRTWFHLLVAVELLWQGHSVQTTVDRYLDEIGHWMVGPFLTSNSSLHALDLSYFEEELAQDNLNNLLSDCEDTIQYLCVAPRECHYG